MIVLVRLNPWSLGTLIGVAVELIEVENAGSDGKPHVVPMPGDMGEIIGSLHTLRPGLEGAVTGKPLIAAIELVGSNESGFSEVASELDEAFILAKVIVYALSYLVVVRVVWRAIVIEKLEVTAGCEDSGSGEYIPGRTYM